MVKNRWQKVGIIARTERIWSASSWYSVWERRVEKGNLGLVSTLEGKGRQAPHCLHGTLLSFVLPSRLGGLGSPSQSRQVLEMPSTYVLPRLLLHKPLRCLDLSCIAWVTRWPLKSLLMVLTRISISQPLNYYKWIPNSPLDLLDHLGILHN